MRDPADYDVTTRPSPNGLPLAVIAWPTTQRVRKSWLGYGIGFAATAAAADRLLACLRRYPADAEAGEAA